MNKQLEQVSRATTDCVSFIWKVEKFPSLSVKTGEFIRSSIVKCSDSHWCLKLFPNGKYKPNQVEVYLEHVGFTSLPTLPSGVKYKIGLKNHSGKNCFKFPIAVPVCASNEDKCESSSGTSVNLESIHSTVTTDASSTSREPHVPLINTAASINQSSSFFNSAPISSVTTTESSFLAKNTYAFQTTTTENTHGFSFASAAASSPFAEKQANFPETTTTPRLLKKPSYHNGARTTPASSAFCFSDYVSTGMTSSKASTSGIFPFSSDTKLISSSFESNNCSSSVGTRGRGSASKSTSKTDKLPKANSIQAQSPILASISTTAPSLCFLDGKENTPDSTWASKSTCFLEANEKMILPRDLLIKMSEDLLPDDVLSVLCEMEVTLVVKVSESTQIHESASTSDGTKLLIEDLHGAFENPRFSDVTLKVGDVQFPAHKIILANRSKVFDAMFDSEMKESQENAVNLVEMKPSIAKDMLGYIYTGSIRELSMDRATDLFVAADRYDMPELKQWCKDFILKHISPDFACDVAILANLHGDEDLAKASKHTIQNNLKAVLSSEKWLSLSEESPAVYLKLLQVALLEESH